MRSILVPVADRPECRTALEHAFLIAEWLSANVVGCHVRPGRDESQQSRGQYLLQVRRAKPGSGELTEKQAGLRSAAGRKLFGDLAGRHAFEMLERPHLGRTRCAFWREIVGSPDRAFRIIGPLADISIVSRPKHNAAGNGSTFLLSAVLHSGKPALILPQSGARDSGRHILIAWNQSIEAARAVSAALPLLIAAESVHICSCGPENRVGPKSAQLARYLTMWGVKTKRTSTKGRDASGEIEQVYAQTGSDLVVMGAYSRHRMREVIFGGVTQHMLFNTAIPVFVLHS